MFWEKKFTLVNMTSCRGYNFRKNIDTNNIKQYIVLGITSKIDFLEKREVTYSESSDSMLIPGKGLNLSLALMTKIPNNKQKARFAIT